VDVFGSFALLLAFICAVYAFVGGIFAIRTRHPLLVKSTRQAGMATCGLIFIATFSLVYLFFSDSYWVSYVVAHSNRDLSTFYKISALWSGQEGSLLFWSFLLAIYVFSALFAYRNKNGELMPYVGVVLAGVQIFFLTLNNFVASPFKVLASPAANGALEIYTRADGNGLNPLLQYPEMVIHPPNLYSGYTGFAIPFAFALGALLARYPGEKWIHLTRKWTMIAWCFQTAGILLGAGKARHDEGLERVAGVPDVHAVHPGNDADAQRHCELGACVCAVEHRELVCRIFGCDSGCLPRGVYQESRLPEK
jgi:cytochrome c-type biogenesis protein CcmF